MCLDVVLDGLVLLGSGRFGGPGPVVIFQVTFFLPARDPVVDCISAYAKLSGNCSWSHAAFTHTDNSAALLQLALVIILVIHLVELVISDCRT